MQYSLVRAYHLCQKIANKIESREFVDMTELLLDHLGCSRSISLEDKGKVANTSSISPQCLTSLICSLQHYYTLHVAVRLVLASQGLLTLGHGVPSLQEFNPEGHLTIKDVAIDRKVELSVVCVTIKQSKTDPFW